MKNLKKEEIEEIEKMQADVYRVMTDDTGMYTGREIWEAKRDFACYENLLKEAIV